jgi:rhodanese-related sulfurtransferase
MKLKKGFRQLVDEAKSRIKTLTLEEARARHGKDDVVFVDLRDVRELEREGMIPDAVHCPRGMLEFWIDPESPYYKEVFGSGKNFIFYCNGAWRSALATDVAQQMGLEPVYEMDGGFAAWKKAGFLSRSSSRSGLNGRDRESRLGRAGTASDVRKSVVTAGL